MVGLDFKDIQMQFIVFERLNVQYIFVETLL